jgi:hypothetical protein
MFSSARTGWLGQSAAMPRCCGRSPADVVAGLPTAPLGPTVGLPASAQTGHRVGMEAREGGDLRSATMAWSGDHAIAPRLRLEGRRLDATCVDDRPPPRYGGRQTGHWWPDGERSSCRSAKQGTPVQLRDGPAAVSEQQAERQNSTTHCCRCRPCPPEVARPGSRQ